MTELLVLLTVLYVTGIISSAVAGFFRRSEAYRDQDELRAGARMVLLCWAWPFLLIQPTRTLFAKLVADAGLTKREVRDE